MTKVAEFCVLTNKKYENLKLSPGLFYILMMSLLLTLTVLEEKQALLQAHVTDKLTFGEVC